MIALANWKWFEKWENERVMKRGEDYEAMKMAFGRRMWDQVLTLYPQLANKVTSTVDLKYSLTCEGL